MLFEGELMAGNELIAVGSSTHHQSGGGLGLHADGDGARSVGNYLCHLRGLFTPAFIDSIETLREFPWVVVDLELVVPGYLHFVRHLANRDAIHCVLL